MTILTRRIAQTACAALVVAASLAPSPAGAAAAAGRWTKQAPVPTWYNVAGTSMISPTEAWVASGPLLGDVGEIAHTTDAGRTWTVVEMPRQVNAVFFVDSLRGWAAGNGFFHTTDGGKSWIQDNDWGTIYDLYFLDATYGWAVGNGAVTYYTTDGGLHWSPVQSQGDSTMRAIWFVDRKNGWSADINGQIFHSTDGGRSWALQATINATNVGMIQFFDLKEGWAVGGDDFYRTANGGKTWTASPVPIGTWAYNARFFDRLNGVAVGEYGNIVRTQNGGDTWQTIAPVGSGQRLWDVEYVDADTLVLAGDNGTIARSTDGGVTWASIQSGGAGVTHGFDSVDSRKAWAGQDAGEIAYTVNGGRQWVRASVQGFDVFGTVKAVAFADASRGWAGGGNEIFGGSYGVVSRSDDGGRTWAKQVQIDEFTFNGLEALDRRTAVAVGSYDFVGGGLVLRTTNAGATWQDVTPNGEGFRDVFFVDASTGWIVGASIYKTTDGGRTWTKQYGDASSELDAISFSDATNGWATGYNNLVLHTKNGGRTWVPQTIDAPPVTAITGVTAIDANTAWIAGWYGFVAVTTTGGKTWRNETIPGVDTDFEDALFVNANRGWVGGNIGIWRHTGAVGHHGHPYGRSGQGEGSQSGAQTSEAVGRRPCFDGRGSGPRRV